VRVRIILKGSGRFTQRWPGAERDFLAARTGPFGEASLRRHEWQ